MEKNDRGGEREGFINDFTGKGKRTRGWGIAGQGYVGKQVGPKGGIGGPELPAMAYPKGIGEKNREYLRNHVKGRQRMDDG